MTCRGRGARQHYRNQPQQRRWPDASGTALLRRQGRELTCTIILHVITYILTAIRHNIGAVAIFKKESMCTVNGSRVLQ